jgi:RNA polymerase sigma-70 factor (ECF subfamily)
VRGTLLATFEQEIEPSADEIVVKLQKAILALPTKQRLVFNVRYYDELSFEQISQATGQSVSTLKTNYHYAVKRIKEHVSVIEIED